MQISLLTFSFCIGNQKNCVFENSGDQPSSADCLMRTTKKHHGTYIGNLLGLENTGSYKL